MKQFEGYEEYLKQSELSKQTRQVYLREAEKFVRYLNGKEITKDRTMLYREKLREEDLSPATINLYVIAVNRYLRYRMRAGIYKDIKSAEKMQCGKCH